MSTTPHGREPLKPSEEAPGFGLRLSREQGEALQASLRHMTRRVADDGRQTFVDDYMVAYAVEKAEGLYVPRDGELRWEEPEEENVHLEIAVCDAADGRFVPGLHVEATLIAPGGKVVGTHVQPFLWHPWLYHYGRNWRVPGDGEYTLRVHIEPPPYARHDKVNGKRFLRPVDVEFEGVHIKTGKG